MLPRPKYHAMQVTVPGTTYRVPPGDAPWYPPVIAGADTLARRHEAEDYLTAALALTEQLSPDPYTAYLSRYYADGRARFGAAWAYADIVTVLLCLARTLKPRTYLEIGVRRGRSA